MAASFLSPQPYQPDGGFNLEGLPLLLGALGGAAVALGWLASFVGQWLYLIILFPLLVGLVLFWVGKEMGRFAKMRNPLLGGLIGLLSAIVGMGSNHYFDYLRFMEERNAIVSLVPGRRVQGKDAALLAKIKKVSDFRSFMEFSAREGITISGREGRGAFNLGYVGTWIYWLIELSVVAIMAAGGLISGAQEPFCTACNSWKYVRQMGTWSADQEGTLLAIIKRGDLAKLPPTFPGGPLVMSVASCLNCGPREPIAVKLEIEVKKCPEKTEKKELAHFSYPGEALDLLEAFFLTDNPGTGLSSNNEQGEQGV